MIPSIRSLAELKLMTDSRGNYNKNNYYNNSPEDSVQRRRNLINNKKQSINLPNLPKIKSHNLAKSKEAISKFLDSLDYNNQIQPTYDLTLLARQNKFNQQDAA